ncbi:MAG: hypothetical protein HY985_09385 [Magnetospirillum sp.]|nr:hypothetical protein [Magnetospirillum sp.]
MTTEIYSCRDGQDLKQGKLDYSSDIDTREQADIDAKRRCQRDPTLKKVAYYKVSDSGDFRVFFSYTNPHCKPTAPGPAAKATVARRKVPAKKVGWWKRMLRALGVK